MMKFIPLCLPLFLLSSCRTLGSLGSTPLHAVAYAPRNSHKDDTIIEHHNKNYVPVKPKNHLLNEHYYDQLVAENRKQKYKNHENNDFSIFFGKYISRQGILKELGDVGSTLGFEIAFFKQFKKTQQSSSSHGIFLLWNFDHFWETNGSLLKPQFKSQDYTNYMLGGGYAYRIVLAPEFQLHYRAGLAVNFIEIDTFASNGDNDHEKYSDVTISTIHKLGADYVIKKADLSKWRPGTQIRLGPSLFYYYAPNPLGKFKINEGSKALSPGGSLAWFLEFKFELY